MDYCDALKYIHSLMRFGSRLGLERIGELLEKMGNPQNKLKFVHVAGTDGKGSTCNMIASILTEAGYKTGLYTSPYVVDFSERMQIDGASISGEELAGLVERYKPLVDEMEGRGLSVTEFELITALAFAWFAERGCDIVVLEVGLGGRFDATNVIDTPLVSVVTSISMDHTDVLGDTIEKIAFEKCGIIKEGGVTVTNSNQDADALAVIMQQAALKNNRLHVANVRALNVLRHGFFGIEAEFDGMRLHIPLCGLHQVENAANALEAVRVLKEKGFEITGEHIVKGLEKVRLYARVEVLCREPLVILDGGHNKKEVGALARVLDEYAEGRNVFAVVGMLADKDYHSALEMLAPLCSGIIAVSPNNPRALPAPELARAAREFCGNVREADSLDDALREIYEMAGVKGLIVICGSLYLAGEIRGKAIKFFTDIQKKT